MSLLQNQLVLSLEYHVLESFREKKSIQIYRDAAPREKNTRNFFIKSGLKESSTQLLKKLRKLSTGVLRLKKVLVFMCLN